VNIQIQRLKAQRLAEEWLTLWGQSVTMREDGTGLYASQNAEDGVRSTSRAVDDPQADLMRVAQVDLVLRSMPERCLAVARAFWGGGRQAIEFRDPAMDGMLMQFGLLRRRQEFVRLVRRQIVSEVAASILDRYVEVAAASRRGAAPEAIAAHAASRERILASVRASRVRGPSGPGAEVSPEEAAQILGNLPQNLSAS